MDFQKPSMPCFACKCIPETERPCWCLCDSVGYPHPVANTIESQLTPPTLFNLEDKFFPIDWGCSKLQGFSTVSKGVSGVNPVISNGTAGGSLSERQKNLTLLELHTERIVNANWATRGRKPGTTDDEYIQASCRKRQEQLMAKKREIAASDEYIVVTSRGPSIADSQREPPKRHSRAP